jgi:hypothetical protein
VWEWTEVAGQALRGGGWNGTGSNVGPTTLARSYNYFEFGITPSYERDHFGFRVAASIDVPEPSAITIVGLLAMCNHFGRGRKKPIVDCIRRD